MVLRRLALLCVMSSLVMSCTSAPEVTTVSSRAADGVLTIGIRYDQPGLSERRVDGKFVGFDIDVARYIATELGVEESGITWREANSVDREKLITSHKVDVVVASYSITDKRKAQVSFAGPYLETGQGLLVRASEEQITGPASMMGRKLCSVVGSTSAQQIKSDFAVSDLALVEYNRYSDCVTALIAGNVDAVTTDEVILAGFAAKNPEVIKLVGTRFSTERYGVGIAKEDAEGRRAVSAAIKKMIESGDWEKSLRRHFGESGIEIPSPPVLSES